MALGEGLEILGTMVGEELGILGRILEEARGPLLAG